MNTNRLLLGALAGFFGYFMSGYLFYVVLFKDLLASTNPGMASVQAEANMIAIGHHFNVQFTLLMWICHKGIVL